MADDAAEPGRGQEELHILMDSFATADKTTDDRSDLDEVVVTRLIISINVEPVEYETHIFMSGGASGQEEIRKLRRTRATSLRALTLKM